MRKLSGGMKAGLGFSLVEIVVVIFVMGIISIGLMDFITNSAGGYAATARRNQLSSAGRVVFDRLAMELHNAVPFSVRTSTPLATTNSFGVAKDQCIEFLPTMAATNYQNPRFRPAAVSATDFDVIDTIPDQVGKTGRYAVIYPTDVTDLYKDAYTTTEVIFEVAIADADTGDGTQELDPTGDYRFTYRSPDERLFITTEPVSFCVSGSHLYRYSNYGFHATQRIPHGPDGSSCAATCLPNSTPDRVLLTDMIDNSVLSAGPFDYLGTTRRRNGVIQIELNFSEAGDSVRLNHEVLQQAAP
jgi:MSHA biogenesis protein MshO